MISITYNKSIIKSVLYDLFYKFHFSVQAKTVKNGISIQGKTINKIKLVHLYKLVRFNRTSWGQTQLVHLYPPL